MNFTRAILISFLGNYLINSFVAPIIALSGITPGIVLYITYFVLGGLGVAALTYWYLQAGKGNKLTDAATFGAIGFLVAFVTAIINAVTGVVAQTGSFARLAEVLPNFLGAVFNVGTAVILAYWIIPAVIVGFLLAPMAKKMMSGPRPML